METDGDDEETLEAMGAEVGGPFLWRNSLAKVWRSPPPPPPPPPCIDDGPPGPYRRCCAAQEALANGSIKEDKSYVPENEEAKPDGMSAIERATGAIAGCGGGGGGGWGSNVARWACKYDNSACRFTTYLNK